MNTNTNTILESSSAATVTATKSFARPKVIVNDLSRGEASGMKKKHEKTMNLPDEILAAREFSALDSKASCWIDELAYGTGGGRDMAEHDLRAIAFPTLNEAQIKSWGPAQGRF